jgi:hypothetical protein
MNQPMPASFVPEREQSVKHNDASSRADFFLFGSL